MKPEFLDISNKIVDLLQNAFLNQPNGLEFERLQLSYICSVFGSQRKEYKWEPVSLEIKLLGEKQSVVLINISGKYVETPLKDYCFAKDLYVSLDALLKNEGFKPEEIENKTCYKK